METRIKTQSWFLLLVSALKMARPQDADIIFDVRTVPNPYYLDELKYLSGLDQPVIDFINKQRETKENFDLITQYLDKYIPVDN